MRRRSRNIRPIRLDMKQKPSKVREDTGTTPTRTNDSRRLGNDFNVCASDQKNASERAPFTAPWRNSPDPPPPRGRAFGKTPVILLGRIVCIQLIALKILQLGRMEMQIARTPRAYSLGPAIRVISQRPTLSLQNGLPPWMERQKLIRPNGGREKWSRYRLANRPAISLLRFISLVPSLTREHREVRSVDGGGGGR